MRTYGKTQLNINDVERIGPGSTDDLPQTEIATQTEESSEVLRHATPKSLIDKSADLLTRDEQSLEHAGRA